MGEDVGTGLLVATAIVAPVILLVIYLLLKGFFDKMF